MDAVADSLATYLIDKLKGLSPERRLLVGICGIPSSGKTTLAKRIVEKIDLLEDGVAVLVGLDGWHYSRAELDKFDDVKEAYDRRGAAFTFDSSSYVKFVTTLRKSPSSSVTPPPQASAIYAPTFDHALKDPTPNGQTILPSHRIVVIEGLYTFINTPEWRPAAEALDERWLIDVDIPEATRRLVQRHVVTGVAKDLEEANWRAENNDMPNGVWVLEHMMEPTRRIKSITEPNL
ncbi:Putative uridine kinase C227,14 OS=Schizosaccharomyces pombe (strain 972 / ATCC 24843) GN=SPAC227.14 PE=3 SV=1 [Rhizoctonia solani AG-1 IB]|uniref:Putative uridine kinase C227,14 n=1 Tax=Thanatephorus cucumeris (strain AG1-IB / isolate 7/3/14) TaxID=1108050 RepID=A0A0B7FK54_THACB|nr:Putative uridine kinase C227,14 OS=Schizosaccharomyces pombe (strain 972 / ATCC 24843) GN=SPAC227.14 PE=3 SV=1 [Rhizoctonia solani AG-1 IB]